MNDIINFNKARKAKVREGDKVQAAANRVKFGRSKTKKIQDKTEADKAHRLLDGAKREET